MESVSPVYSEREIGEEKVIALDQKQYSPIVIIPIDLVTEEKTVKGFALSVRFRLSDEERAKIANGCDLVITELVFGCPFTPLNFQFLKPGEAPEV